MYSEAKVWANVGTRSQSAWVKAKVVSVTRLQEESSRYAKFVLEIEKISKENKSILSHTSGDQLEIITELVEGSTDEFECVKLRNVIDDFETDSIEDLINLHHLHECSILNCLEARYRTDKIYTTTGPVLISVNPFKGLQVYTPLVGQAYREAGEQAARAGRSDTAQNAALPPHVFGVADLAFRHMSEGLEARGGHVGPNQSILVSGESGAGKTETTKFIMKYLADITTLSSSFDISATTPPRSQAHASIETQVLQSNPILESFGNARTLRNDNSSRFGKYIEINFEPTEKDPLLRRKFGHLSIVGATIRTYLLEKVRIVRQAPGERNYHVFYELINGASDQERARLGLSSVEEFHYTAQSVVHHNSRRNNRQSRHSISYNSEEAAAVASQQMGSSDSLQFQLMRRAMDMLNFSPTKQDGILDVLAIVLHLGNIAIEEKDGEAEASTMRHDAHTTHACRLLGIEPPDLHEVLCERRIITHNSSLVKCLTPEDARTARDSFAKALYGALFDSIIVHVNSVISASEDIQDPQLRAVASSSSQPPQQKAGARPSDSAFIGVLDIFGFESFPKNSFEQLCINYTNEKLQFNFNAFMFQHEQDLYEREGIEWGSFSYPDNKEVLELLENRTTGIFALCDEQVKFPQATDLTLVNKLYDHCRSYSRFHAGSTERGHKNFIVHHYAGRVTYSSESFLEKNNDKVPADMVTLLADVSMSHTIRDLAEYVGMHSSQPEGQQQQRPRSTTSIPGELSERKGKGSRRQSVSCISLDSAGSVSSQARFSTLSAEFRLQLNSLMTKINRTSPHYIRCIKPNESSQADIFDPNLVLNQLNCSGVLECIRVTRAGYPVKMLFHEFLWQYRCLLTSASMDMMADAKVDRAISTLSIPKIDLNEGSGSDIEKEGALLPDICMEVHALCVLLAKLYNQQPQNSPHSLHEHGRGSGGAEGQNARLSSSVKNSVSDSTWRRSPAKGISSNYDPYHTWRVSPMKALGGGDDSEASGSDSTNSTPDSLNAIAASIELSLMLDAGMQMGKTRVFLRQNTFNFLEMKKLEVTVRAAVKAQACVRRFKAMSAYIRLQAASVRLQSFFRRLIACASVKHLRVTKTAIILQRVYRGYATRVVLWTWDVNALMIQLQARRRLAQRKVQHMRRTRASTRVSACWRSSRDWRRFRDMSVSALRIQMFLRFHRAQKVLRQLRFEAHSLQHQLVEKDVLLQEAREEAAQAARQIADAQQKLEILKVDTRQWEAKTQALSRSNIDLLESLEKQKEEHSHMLGAAIQDMKITQEAELLAKSTSSSVLLKTKDVEIALLKSQVALLTSELDAAEVFRTEKDGVIADLTQAVDQLRACEANEAERYRLINEEWAAAASQVVEAAAANASLKEVAEQAEARACTLVQQLEKSTHELEAVQHHLRDEVTASKQRFDDECARMNSVLASLQDQNSALILRHDELDAILEEVVVLRFSVQCLEGEKLALSEEGRKRADEARVLSERNEGLREEGISAALVVEDLAGKIADRDRQNSALLSQLDAAKSDKVDLLCELGQLSQAVAALTERVELQQIELQKHAALGLAEAAEKEELSTKLRHLSESNSNLEDRKASMELETTQLKSKVADLMHQIEEVSAAKKALDKKNKAALKSMEHLKKSLHDKESDHNNLLDAKNLNIAHLSQQKDECFQRITCLESELVTVKNAVSMKEEELQDLQSELNREHIAARSMTEDISKLKALVRKKQGENSTLAEDIVRLNEQVVEFSCTCAALEDKNCEEMTFSLRMKEDLMRLTEELQHVKKDFDASHARASELLAHESQNSEAHRKEVSSLENVIAMLSDENAELKDNLSQVTERQEMLRRELQEVQLRCNTWEDRHTSAKDQSRLLDAALAEKMDELVDKSTELMVLQKCVRKLTHEKDELKSVCKDQRDELDVIMAELSQMSDILAEKDIECLKIDSNLGAKTAAVVSLSAGVLSLNAKLSELEVLLATKSKAVSDMSSTIETLNEEMDAVFSEKEYIEGLLLNKTGELDSAHAQIEALDEKLAALTLESSQQLQSLTMELLAARGAASDSLRDLEHAKALLADQGTDLEKMQGEVENLYMCLSTAKKSTAAVEEQLLAASDEVNVLRKDNEQLLIKIEDGLELQSTQRGKIESLELELGTLQQTSDVAISAKDTLIHELESSIQELVLLETLMEKELSEEGLALPTLVSVVTELEQRGFESEGDGIVTHSGALEGDEKLSQQESALAASETHVNELKVQTKELQATIDVLIESEAASKKVKSRLVNQVSRAQAECAAARAEVTVLKRQLNKANIELDKFHAVPVSAITSPPPVHFRAINASDRVKLNLDGGGIFGAAESSTPSRDFFPPSQDQQSSDGFWPTSFSYTPLRESHLLGASSSHLSLPLQSPSSSAAHDHISCSHHSCSRKFTTMGSFLLHIEMEHDSQMFSQENISQSAEEEQELETEKDLDAEQKQASVGAAENLQAKGTEFGLSRRARSRSGGGSSSSGNGGSNIDSGPSTPKASVALGRADALCVTHSIEQMMPSDFFSYIVDNLQVPPAPHGTTTKRDLSSKHFSCLFDGCNKKYKSEEGLIDHMKDFHILKHVTSPANKPLYSTPLSPDKEASAMKSNLPDTWSPQLKGFVTRSLSYCRTDSDLAATVAHLKYQISKVSQEKNGRVNDHAWETERSPMKPPPAPNSTYQQEKHQRN